MPRIAPVTEQNANPDQKAVLSTVKAKFGGVPNLLATLTNAPAAANAYLALSGALADTSLSAKQREQIALAIAGANSCDYCAAAHTAIGAGVGLSKDAAAESLAGHAEDPKDAALLTLARQIVEQRGFLQDDQIEAARDAGISDPEILEVVALVALNILTNYTNHIAETEIDFPKVTLPEPAETT